MKIIKAYLLIHGFGGGPFELEALQRRLGKNEAQDLIVKSVTLPGHMDTRRALGQSSYKDWLRAVEKAYEDLCQHIEPDHICIIGFSMGGLLASHLATKYEVGKLVTINMPIYYWDFKNVFSNILNDIKKRELRAVKRYINSCFMYPMGALIQFKLLHIKTRRCVKKVTCPILVVQAKDDDAVNHKSADYIMRKVQSKHKEVIYFDEGGHGLLMGDKAEEVVEIISKSILY